MMLKRKRSSASVSTSKRSCESKEPPTQAIVVVSRQSNLGERVKALLLHLYGLAEAESGFGTIGHKCTAQDENLSVQAQWKSDPLYGEVMFEGAQRMFDAQHLDLANARYFTDFGCGVGKLAIQAFLEHTSLMEVHGVEIVRSRFDIAVQALKKLVGMAPNYYVYEEFYGTQKDGRQAPAIVLARVSLKQLPQRRLEVHCGSVFEWDYVPLALRSDVIVFETKCMNEKYAEVCELLNLMRPDTRLLTYENLDSIYTQQERPTPFARLDVNYSASDRFLTTWAPKRGHHFHLWRKAS